MDLISNNQQPETENDFFSKLEWTWDKECSTSVKLGDKNSNVTFHPVYNTAVVRGNKLLEKGRHHFWEILMLSKIHGTDVVIGVGTTNAKLDIGSVYFWPPVFNQEFWGFSCKGYIQHDYVMHKYGTTFDKGQLVGVHLDAWSGTLQFFLNRKPLGVAFSRLNNVALYPLINCTMAHCMMKLTYSCSMPVSLQTACLAILSPSQKAYLSKAFPGLRYLSKSIFADILHKFIDHDSEEDIEFPAEYVILDDFDFALVGVKKKKYQ